MSKGSDLDALKRGDWTPMMLAAAQNQLAAVETLIHHRASTAVVNKDGWNAFHIACRTGHVHIVDTLFQATQRAVQSVSRNGRSALNSAGAEFIDFKVMILYASVFRRKGRIHFLMFNFEELQLT